jgi:hypothetical protein
MRPWLLEWEKTMLVSFILTMLFAFLLMSGQLSLLAWWTP